MVTVRFPLMSVVLVGCGALTPVPLPAAAQEVTSRPVVQGLPAKEVDELRDALRALDRAPRNVDALLNAGFASIKVNDLDAAMGYFGRAEEAAPNDQRIRQAQAIVFLRSGRPVEALRLFAESEAAGASSRTYLSDRGLAYDMVGDQVRAQAFYREALRETPNDNEIVRRMAVSQAISGNEAAFLDTLRPLVDRQDFPAFRSQAFGLAILGEGERAKDVTEAVMPSDLARRIIPYLGYMPRLTKAQQAAAANLGIFPKAADIGRDDPKIAAYLDQSVSPASSTVLARAADNRLEPAGEPLGQPTQAVTPVPASAQPAVRVARVEPVAVPVPSPAAKPDPDFASAFAGLGRADTRDVAKASDAVDINAIVIPREARSDPDPAAASTPKGPVPPERFWVQLGTGFTVEPLKYDWRRLARLAPEELNELKGHSASFGDKYRLLAGPFTNKAKRDEVMRSLTAKGLGVLPFTSPEGMEVQELK